MKNLISFLFLLTTFFCSAQESYVEYAVPAAGARAGLIVVRPDSFIPGKLYPLIVMSHGIGEVGNGSPKDLERLKNTPSISALEAQAKKYGFIVIEPQTSSRWQYGETEEAYQWAKDSLYEHINWKKVYLTGLSWGGGNVFRYLSINPSAHLLFAAAAPMCGANLVSSKDYNTLVNTKVPTWFFHNIGDSVVKASGSTLLIEKKWKDAKGTANFFFTIFLRAGHTWPAYNRGEGQKAVSLAEATGLNNPEYNLYEWFLANEIGKPTIAPTYKIRNPRDPVLTPLPGPAVIIDTIILKQPVAKASITGFTHASDGKNNNSFAIQIFWTDSISTLHKAVAGDRIISTYWSKKLGQITITYSKAGTQVIGPYKESRHPSYRPL